MNVIGENDPVESFFIGIRADNVVSISQAKVINVGGPVARAPKTVVPFIADKDVFNFRGRGEIISIAATEYNSTRIGGKIIWIAAITPRIAAKQQLRPPS